MNIIADTGPLIGLAKVDQLTLLAQLFEQIYIPPAVKRELLAKHGLEANRLEKALQDILIVTSRPDLSPEVQSATAALEDGEREAIALAHSEQLPLLVDDRRGRSVTQRLGVSVFGTAGFLLHAKRVRRIPSILPILQEMRVQGYWLSDELLTLAAKLSDEN
jgi:hypothetical protein